MNLPYLCDALSRAVDKFEAIANANASTDLP